MPVLQDFIVQSQLITQNVEERERAARQKG
jgi:hypothetical protein